MNVSLYQAAAALNANTRWHEVIAGNLAASSIPGFKKQDLSFSAVQAGLMSSRTSSGAPPGVALPHPNASTNFEAGELKPTGNPMDVAIDGTGFFGVQLPDGSIAYTRDGEFRVNSQGLLATKNGLPVVGDHGAIQIDQKNPAPISISSTGEVTQGTDHKGRIKLASFPNPQLLSPAGGGLFLASDPKLKPGEVAAPALRQGFLEGANTSPVLEMSNLISAMRQFEANQRIIQVHDDRMGKAISELGSPT